jgi:hypothetical protein
LDGLIKSESRRPPNRHITGATTGVFSASTKRAGSAPCSSRGCASPAAGRPDFRFGLSEIGAFSSLLYWFCGLGVRGGGGQKTLAFGPPALGPKNPSRFWGVPRPRNEKPGAVSRAGLGHTPEGYLFIHEFRFNVQKSQVAQRSQVHHAEVVFGIPRNICWAPHRWRPSSETKNSTVQSPEQRR